jgi:hypothetical protein
LGQVNEFWLLLEEESGRYFIGHRMWVTAKPQRRYVNEEIIAKLTMWLYS